MVELPVSKTICPLVLQPGFRLNALCSPPDGRAVGSARPNRGAIRAKTCSDPPPRPAHPIASPCRIYLPADITHKPGCSTNTRIGVRRLFETEHHRQLCREVGAAILAGR